MNSNLMNHSNHSQSLPLSPPRKHNRKSIPYITSAKEARANHIVFLDWDNTLFPTTAFFDDRQSISNSINSIDLQTVSESVLDLLNTYSGIYGADNIFIVTNGKNDWVLQSLRIVHNYCKLNGIKNCFESIYKLILNCEIQSISANDVYGTKYPKQSMIWKYLVFKDIANVKCCNNPCIVICIGDSYDEYNASKLMSSHVNITALHRLKLISKPSMRAMNEQLQLMMSLGSIFVDIKKDITIDYAKAKAEFMNKNTNKSM